MSHYKASLSPLTETASKLRLSEYYSKQKGLQYPVYYLLPSNKWLQSARKRQPGMAFKTFDDLADLILKKAGVKYVSVSESERILFFQQLLTTKEGLNTIDNPHKAKAYAQTYGQLKRLGLSLEHLPKGLEKLKAALYLYEEDWVKKQRKMSVTVLTEKVGITMSNLSILKNGKAKAIRFSTLEAICKALDCQPGDILEYSKED